MSLPAVGLISGAALGYELLLLRYFSLMYWSHFAHLIIGMALLGFGFSGTILTLFQHRLLRRFHSAFALSALLFSITLLTASSLAGRLGFNPPETIWDPGQFGRLAAVFILTSLPFSCAGLCIGLTLRSLPGRIAQVYRADLTGAACGALLVMTLLFVLPPRDLVRVLAATGLAAGLLIHADSRQPHMIRLPVLAAVALLVAIWPGRLLAPQPSPFKGLSQALHVPGASVAGRTLSPAGEFTALLSTSVPFRYAPGLSMLAPSGPPEQVALFHDGNPAGVIHRGTGGSAAMEFMRWTPMALPYALLHRPRVLVLGAGGGGDIWHALLEGASRVDAVEPYRQLSAFASSRLAAFAGGVYDRDGVRLFESDSRGFLAAARDRYDLIQISPFGSAAPSGTGGHALDARYLLTVEGIGLALSRLTANGILAVTLPLDLPPRAAPRMLATIAEALRLARTTAPAEHVAAIRTWNTVTIAASPSPLSAGQRQAVRTFCRLRAFDLVWLPDITPVETNRYTLLAKPFFYEAARDIWQGTGDRPGQPFNLSPTTDDRPWFGHFFRWRSLPELWRQRKAGSAAMLEWEYLLLWMSLAVAVAVSLVMIVLPLRLPGRRPVSSGPANTGNAIRAAYFAALGLAFFFLEIACIQHFVLFLSHPMLAMAVVVPSFLFFAGCGSGRSGKLAEWTAASRRPWLQDRPAALAAAAITTVSCIYLLLLPPLFQAGAAWPAALRVAVSILLIGGLAFWMGMPFPLGMSRLGTTRPEFIPLAWGVNGFFSVISTIAATILALHGGFRLLTAAALALYLLAAICERRL